MNFVKPIRIAGPSGQTSTPKIIERVVGDKIYVEAHWYDPASGIFFHKGVVEIRDIVQPKKEEPKKAE